MTDEGIDKKELLKEFSQAAAPETKPPEAAVPQAEAPAESPRPPARRFRWSFFANVGTILIGAGWIVLGFLSDEWLPYLVGGSFVLLGAGLVVVEKRAAARKEPAAAAPGEERKESPKV